MRISNSIPAVILMSLSRISADGMADFASLKALVIATTEQITSSLSIPPISNASTAVGSTYVLPVGTDFPTSSAIQNITATIEQSKASCASNSTEFCNGNTMDTLDAGYMEYINEIPSLSQALVSRGRAWRPEWNQPVYSAIYDLAGAVFEYGTELTKANVISETSTIRTISAGGTLTSAEEAWDKPGTLPGKRSKFLLSKKRR